MCTDHYDYLKKEYEQWWNYIKFHYEQRDRSQRFYFSFVLAGGGLVVALSQQVNDLRSLRYLLLLIVPLVVIGILALGQLIHLRRVTTLYHKTIVTIRRQMIGSGKSPLCLSDKDPRFYATGFNFFTVLIVMLLTASIAAFGIFVVMPASLSDWWRVVISLAAGVLIMVSQFLWYRRALRMEDLKYDARALFPGE